MRIFFCGVAAVLVAAVASCSSDKACVKSYTEVGGPDAPCRGSRTSTATDQACFTQPQICPNLSPINFCNRIAGLSHAVSILVENRGETPLKISGIRTRGDGRCTFKKAQISPPVGTPLEPGDSLVIRFKYEPPAGMPAFDSAALEMVSDAENLPTLAIPLCAKAITSTIGVDPNNCMPCPDMAMAAPSPCFEMQ